MIELAPATLTDTGTEEMYAVCATNPRYWEYSGDLDPGNLTREAVAAMLREEAAMPGCDLLVAREPQEPRGPLGTEGGPGGPYGSDGGSGTGPRGARGAPETGAGRAAAGRLVGIAQVLRRHPVDGHPWIGLLLVDGRLHRQGYGRALAAALEEWFRQAGEPGVRLGVLAGNVEAQHFWTALGYREIDRRPDVAKGRETLVMHRDL